VIQLEWEQIDAATYEAASIWHDEGSPFRYRLARRAILDAKGRVIRRVWQPEHDAEIAGLGPQGPWVNLSSATRAIGEWHCGEFTKWQAEQAAGKADQANRLTEGIGFYQVIGENVSGETKGESGEHRDD
jgi:hypothetical protein